MKLPTEIFGNVVVVHTPQEIGEDQADQLESYLSALDRSNVVVDMDGTEAVDSAALEAMLNTQDSLRELQGDLKICTTNSVNRKILELTRLDQQLEVFESVIDAVKSFA